ncbi:cryptochrome/photolyase family protein [Aquabacter spiritensis]|uniref:Deoxyribodipyrimidine photo-lyase n=1 Tax=Aquabacter spiritensis TaxID=933073 RepID=A0A4R3LPN6_9HYPH|nr:deoxyribodipyrimidine photo-lyase [Aquabacter spiritensis]TCT02444.1 deoxyribodipyrimidine photo-lyase [Aquabacter spiritensis]
MRPALVWFRSDLRLADNPALIAAAREGRQIGALFVWDEDSPGIRPLGGAARWWLAHSLRALAADLGRFDIPLILRRGPAAKIVTEVAEETGSDLVAFNARSGAAEAEVDRTVASALEQAGCTARRFNGALLHAPGTVHTAAGGLPRTFSAFRRAAQKLEPPRQPKPIPAGLLGIDTPPKGDLLETWGLEPVAPDWASGIRAAWQCGEAAAQARLAAFLDDGLNGYAEGRDSPAAARVSRLSPHLRWGEISPHQVLASARHAAQTGSVSHADADKFEAELYWREFAHHVLAAEPDLAQRNLQTAFDAFPWRECIGELKVWRAGRTGYPLVDAGMRELWQTGWMHNRVRMVVGSFLAKHLLIPWQEGESWFWDTLVDADPASNPCSWQWVAGTGVDAAPYFRIFNPVLQGEKFDPDGTYVRAFVPELAKLPAPFIHRPWTADAATLARAGVRLGITYPKPIIAHDAARDRALRAFAHIKSGAGRLPEVAPVS